MILYDSDHASFLLCSQKDDRHACGNTVVVLSIADISVEASNVALNVLHLTVEFCSNDQYLLPQWGL